MQVEDEILSEIGNRDTAIMMKDKEIEQLIEQNKQVIEQKNLIIKSTIKKLVEKGMSLSEIASIVLLTEEEISKLSET